ncbi:MAG: hypothetical protein GY822_19365 [Deltaproteobacteria bacterium]|nr:hypothetical protein [Deltaproteobacteria bacterium]
MTTMTLDLEDKMSRDLTRLSHRRGRSQAELAKEAVKQFIDYENSLQASIDAGVEDLNAGRVKTTEEMMANLGIDMPEI